MEVAAGALAAEQDDNRRRDHHDCGDTRPIVDFGARISS
jgi:hypothetical protein